MVEETLQDLKLRAKAIEEQKIRIEERRIQAEADYKVAVEELSKYGLTPDTVGQALEELYVHVKELIRELEQAIDYAHI